MIEIYSYLSIMMKHSRLDSRTLSINIEEIQKLLMEIHGYNLIIKGPPGAGKSTLALEILKSNPDGIYISTRLTPKSLYNQFPWIEDYLKQENILDASQTYIPDTRNLGDHLKSILYYQDIPAFIKILYEKTSEINNPIVVIDSWNAIIESSQEGRKDKNPNKTNYMFAEFVRQMNAKVIMVLEEEGKTNWDYIADGILSLENIIDSGRILRKLQITKLRCQEIRNPIREYTLLNGRFRCMDIFNKNNMKTFARSFLPNHDLDEKESLLAGITNLDKLLNNGLKRRQSLLIERKGIVSEDNLLFFLFPYIINNLKGNGRIIMLPPMNFDLENQSILFENNFSFMNFSNNFRILDFSVNIKQEQDLELSQIQIRFDEGDIFEDKHKDMENIFQNIQNESMIFNSSIKSDNPLLYILYLDSLEYKFNMINFVDILGKFISFIKSTGKIAVLITKPNLKYTGDIMNMVDKHLVLEEKDGLMKIYTEKPWSEYYGLKIYSDEEVKGGKSKFKADLQKIV